MKFEDSGRRNTAQDLATCSVGPLCLKLFCILRAQFSTQWRAADRIVGSVDSWTALRLRHVYCNSWLSGRLWLEIRSSEMLKATHRSQLQQTGGKTRMPSLIYKNGQDERVIHSDADKADILYQEFFKQKDPTC